MTHCTPPKSHRLQKLIWIVLSLFCAPLATVFGQETTQQPSATESDQSQGDLAEADSSEATDEVDLELTAGFDLQLHLQSFDQVWETVATTHWDEELIQEKWTPLKDKYRPQIESAKNIRQVRKIIQSMIEELELSHFGIIQASAIDVIRPAEQPGDATAGMEFRLSDDGVLVWQVAEGSSAEKAGVEPGWLVERIGELEVPELLEQIRTAAHGPMRAETLVGLALSQLASGPPQTTKNFRFFNRDAEPQELDLELQLPEGQFAKFGHLPPIRVQIRKRCLPDDIGYFWFNAFLDPVRLMPEFRDMVHSDASQSGFVLDLRANMGGLAGMTMGMASEFSASAETLGTMSTKGQEIRFFVNAAFDPVACPVAVLVDECSISSAEILAGGLQDLKLARIFGSRTAGLALPSVVVRLPNGDGFQYAMANYHSASGKSLEMNGVTPDEEITLSRELLLVDTDPVLTRAIEWILKENLKSKSER